MVAPVSSVLRRGDGLVVRTHGCTGAFTKPSPGASCAKELRYEAVDVPLARFGGEVWPGKHALAAAHARLARVADVDARVLADVLLLAISTVAAGDVADEGPVFKTTEAPRPHRRTAAHPRGYRGTTYQPPKAAREVVDVGAAIATSAGLREALARGWTHRKEAARLLDAFPLDRLVTAAEPPSDPFLSVWSSERARVPGGFAEDLLWTARRIGGDAIRRLSGLARDLALESNQQLRFAVAMLLARHPTAATIEWIASVRHQPPERRLAYVAMLLETDVCGRVVCPGSLMMRIAATATDERYEPWCFSMLEGLAAGASPGYLETGVGLAGDYAPEHQFWRVRPGALDRSVVDELLARVGGARPWLAMNLWRSAGLLPGLDMHLRALRDASVEGEVLGAHLDFVAELADTDDGVTTVARWRAVEPHLMAVAEMVAGVPSEYTSQAPNDLGVVITRWSSAADVRRWLADAIALVGRLQTPPMSPDGNVGLALRAILECPKAAPRARMLSAPLAVFVRLDKACRRKNDAELLAAALHGLVTSWPDLAASAFLACPGTLFRVAKLLGCYNWRARAQVMDGWSDAMPVDPPDDPRTLATLLAGTGLVPKALRAWADGTRALTDAQLAGHVRTLQARWPEARLRSLEAWVQRDLRRSVGADVVPPAMTFALQMLRDSSDNRRGLRRFLRAYLDGDEAYLAEHPATRQWLARHPRIDPVRWAEGITTSVTRGDGVEIVLAIEQDPLEVLRMGTYVGSCLALGGTFSGSAVAVLLDVNKTVIYARDAAGAVLARQLVAISEADELVAFAVYPKVAPWLEAAFRQFNARLAQHLGVPRCRTEKYEVADVLSRWWWDDGRWDDAEPRHSARAAGRR